MLTYYVNYARPNDSGDGLTPATAWKNISKINSALAGVTTPVRVIIDTTSTPMLMDQQLCIHNKMKVVGIGNLRFTGTGGRIISGVADLRAYKTIAANTWTLVAGKTRTYQSADTESTSVLWKFSDWAGHTQPLYQLTKVNGASYAAVAATLDATVDQYFTDGTNMYVTASSSPASSGDVYVRSQPSVMTFASSGSIGNGNSTINAAVWVNGVDCSFENLAIGGNAAITAAGVAQQHWSLVIWPGVSTNIVGKNSFAYSGSTHTFGIYNEGMTGAQNSLTRLFDVRWGHTVDNGGIPGILFFDTTTGHVIGMKRCRADYAKPTASSTEGESNLSQVLGGHGNGTPGISRLTLEDCEIGAGSDGVYKNYAGVLIDNTVLADGALTITRGYYSGIMSYSSAAYNSVHFCLGMPATNVACIGKTQTLRYCSYIPRLLGTDFVGSVSDAYGTFDVQYCFIDISNSLSGYFDNHLPLWNYQSGNLTLIYKNNVFKTKGDYAVPLLGNLTALNQSGLTITMSYNVFSTTLSSGSSYIFMDTGRNPLLTDAQLLASAYGTGSLVYTGTYGYTSLIQSGGVLQPESPLVNLGSSATMELFLANTRLCEDGPSDVLVETPITLTDSAYLLVSRP